MNDPIHVLGLAGSLREKSFNRAMLDTAVALAPDDLVIETFDHLREMPLYDEDVRVSQGFPPAVEAFREKIRAADAMLIATPEYNHSIPGVLKNAIDWASRPPDQPFNGLPIAIMGASPGRFGTARAQYHLRTCFVALNGLVLNKPEVMIGGAGQAFDDQLHLIDDKTREMIQRLLVALADWTRRQRRPRP